MVKFKKLNCANTEMGYPPLKIVRRPFGVSGFSHRVPMLLLWGVALSFPLVAWLLALVVGVG
jgi:hypothetical protein